MNDRAHDPFAFIGKRERRKRRLAVCILVLLILWVFRPHWRTDESVIDPRLQSLPKPYRLVTLSDCGEYVLMSVTGAGGQTEESKIQSETVFIKTGNVWSSSQYRATFQELGAIAADECSSSLDWANLAAMTGRPGDRIKSEAWRAWEGLRDWWNDVR